MKCSISEVLRRLTDRGELRDFVAAYVCKVEGDFFSTLIVTVLSQNSTDRAAFRAYENLKSHLGRITPEKIADLNMEVLKELIRVAGLHNSKALTIKELAEEFLRGELTELMRERMCEQVRDLLLKIRGIGEKTADVFLLTCLSCEVFPSDTHIKRVLSRLENRKLTYREIAELVLSELHDPESLLELHHKLITHGRKVCKAKRPLCEVCPLRQCCGYYETNTSGPQGALPPRGRD